VNKDLCAKIWTVLGAAASLTALNVFVQSQGGMLFTGGYLIEKRPVIASFDAILIVSALLIVVCLVGVRYARLSSGDAWSTRLPIVGDDGKNPVETASWSLRFYQAFFVLAFVVVPASSVIHFNDKVWNVGVVWSDAPGSAMNAIPVKCTMTSAEDGCDAGKISKVFAPTKNGRLWLAETVHAPKQFQLKRDGGTPPPSLAQDFRDHDLSEECRKDSEACRGVQWLHPWSLIGSWFMTALAMISVAFLFRELLVPKRSDARTTTRGNETSR
jgi:hypothetical protein